MEETDNFLLHINLGNLGALASKSLGLSWRLGVKFS